jgi:recombination protein RecA
LVEKSGSWYSYDSQRIGQGRENAKQFLADHPEMADAIEAAIREAAGLGAKAPVKIVEDGGAAAETAEAVGE